MSFESLPLASLHLISMAQLFTNLSRFQFEATSISLARNYCFSKAV